MIKQSKYTVFKLISPNQSGKRKYSITRITPHCVVGSPTAESLGNFFHNSSLQASSNYGIDRSGRVGLYVEEDCRSWCSSSEDNDNRAITIECASDVKPPYTMTNDVYKTLIKLCVDICQRYNKNTLVWIPDKKKALKYKVKNNEMLITVHRWFSKKDCPGDWLYSRLGSLAETVTKELQHTKQFKEYRVKVTINDLNIRTGASTSTKIIKPCPPGIYTIIEERKGAGATKWGKLKSGVGWISLDYVDKI